MGRLHAAPEPAGPLSSRGRSGSARAARRTRTVAAWVVVQLLAVLAVYAAHERWVAPRVEAAVAERTAPPRALLARSGGRRAATAAADFSACPSHCRQAGAAAANCSSPGVRLHEADRDLLEREIGAIARALADQRPWAFGEPDAAAAEEQQDSVRRGEALRVQGAPVPRLADQAYGAHASANVPGVQDLHTELAAYADGMVEAMMLDAAAAARRQQHTHASELGLAPLDPLNETASIPARIAFLNKLHAEVAAQEQARVCIVTTTSADLLGVRQELLPWLQWHTEIGVSRFYVLYDGSDPAAVAALAAIRAVTLLHIHPPWATPTDLATYAFYANTSGREQWGGQPGNYALMVKQGYGESEALARAAADGMAWLLHLDPDELFLPGGPVASLPAVLARQPAHAPSLRFMNFEGQPEAGDLTNRYEQVTLFRVHKHFITPEAFHYRNKYKLGDNAAFLMLYANGKSAVRVGAPGVRHMGPHFFAGEPSPRWQTAENPRGEWRDAVSDDSVVLHYAYSYLSDVAGKAHRSCPNEYLEAARRGDRAKVRTCFVIDFDAEAYLAAAAGPAAIDDFFYSRLVLSEGSRVRCHDPQTQQEGWCTLTNIPRFKHLMEKVGLMRRILAPQLVLRQHERQIRAGQHAQRRGAGGGGPAA